MPRVVISMHKRFHFEIHRLCVEGKAVSGPLDFEHLLLHSDRTGFASHTTIDEDDVCESLMELKKDLGLEEEDFFLMVVDGNLSDRSDDEYLSLKPRRGKNLGIVSLHFLNEQSTFMKDAGEDWLRWSETKRNKVTSQLVTLLLLSGVITLTAGLECHEETRGCVMDYCQRPTDFLEVLRRDNLLCNHCSQLVRQVAMGESIVALAKRVGDFLRSPRIFVSYARADGAKVESVYQKLEDAGFRPWMDRKDILPGEPWETKIREAIRDADFFLACLSQNSVNRRGLIQSELKEALKVLDTLLDSDIYLIPLRLEDCNVPESLAMRQWVDLFASDGWPRLLQAIQEGTERRRR